MSRTKVTNTALEGIFGFPAPYSGVLRVGSSAVLSDTPEQIIANLGGNEDIKSNLRFDIVPDNVPLTSHNTNPGALIGLAEFTNASRDSASMGRNGFIGINVTSNSINMLVAGVWYDAVGNLA